MKGKQIRITSGLSITHMETIRIGEACDILNGFAFKSENYVDSGIRVIRIANVQKGYIEDNTPAFYPLSTSGLDKYMLESGDLLMSLTGNVGRVALLDKEFLPAALNQRVACLRLKSNFINKKYLFHILNSNFFEQECIRSSKGVAQKNMSTEWLKGYEIPLYSAKEQKKIVSTLDTLQSIITHRRTQLEKLDLLVKARFVEMFGEVGTDKFGWGLQKIGDICEINPKKAKESKLHSELKISFVPMPAVSEYGNIDATEIKTYEEVKSGFTYFAEDDVLFAKITPCMENGKGCIARGLCNGIGFGSTEFHVIRPTAKTNPYWIYNVTVFKQFRKDAAANMTGSAGQRRVPAKFLENYKVALPPIELQTQFADFVKQVDKSKATVQKALDEAQLLFDSLMQEYFG